MSEVYNILNTDDMNEFNYILSRIMRRLDIIEGDTTNSIGGVQTAITTSSNNLEFFLQATI